MGGQTDRSMVLDNLELVLLLIDEHCDGGIILEVDANKLAGSVLLKDEEENAEMNGAAEAATSGMNGIGGGLNIGLPGRQGAGDISIAQAFRQARAQLIAGLSSPDGM